MKKLFYLVLLVAALVGCGTDGKDGVNGTNGKDGTSMTIDRQLHCTMQIKNHPDYYSVWINYDLTYFMEGAVHVSLGVTIIDYPNEYQYISKVDWWDSTRTSYLETSVTNHKVWYVSIDNKDNPSLVQIRDSSGNKWSGLTEDFCY